MDTQYIMWGLGVAATAVVAAVRTLLRLNTQTQTHAQSLNLHAERLAELSANNNASVSAEEFQAFKAEFQAFMQRAEDKLDGRLLNTEAQVAALRESVARVQGTLDASK